MQLLARALRGYLELSHDDPGVYAIFMDFLSLFQKGPDGQERTPSEGALFGKALGSLAEWYSHPNTTVLKLSRLPEGYPDGFTFPTDIVPNTADYHGRGWCFTESAVAGLAKHARASLDLGLLPPEKAGDMNLSVLDVWNLCKVQRAPPLTPVEFARQLATKSFTSKKADMPTVLRLYEQAYTSRLGELKSWDLSGLDWDDDAAKQVAAVLASGVAAKIALINLRGNRITATGLHAIANAVYSRGADGHLVVPKLYSVMLDGDHGDVKRDGQGRWTAPVVDGELKAAIERFSTSNLACWHAAEAIRKGGTLVSNLSEERQTFFARGQALGLAIGP